MHGTRRCSHRATADLANDVIGTGPRLQMLADGSTGLAAGSAEGNRTIEAEFARWAKVVGLPEKLRTMRQARGLTGKGATQGQRLSVFLSFSSRTPLLYEDSMPSVSAGQGSRTSA